MEMRNRNKVENMEQRLKKDVMNELRIPSNGGNIVVHEEVTTHHVDSLPFPSLILSCVSALCMLTLLLYSLHEKCFI